MNTSNFDKNSSSSSQINLAIAESYYASMLAKNFDTMSNFLHENVHFISPLAEMRGKESVLESAKNFGAILQDIEIRSRFLSDNQKIQESDNQIMLVYNMTLPNPIGKFRAASLMEFSDDKISKIELFFDARAFEK